MNDLYIREKNTFVRAKCFRTYKQAVQAGQASVGYGNFFVDTGDTAPSREQQLLVDQSTKNKTQKQIDKILSTI